MCDFRCLQAQREPPPSLSECKDKFLVQSLKISPETTEITPDLFEAGAGKVIKQSKLRVVLVGPPKPPSPVPEGIEEEASPIRVREFSSSLCQWQADCVLSKLPEIASKLRP